MNYVDWKRTFLHLTSSDRVCFECTSRAESMCPVSSIAFCSEKCQSQSDLYKSMLPIEAKGDKRKHESDLEYQDRMIKYGKRSMQLYGLKNREDELNYVADRSAARMKKYEEEQGKVGDQGMLMLLQQLKDNPTFLKQLLKDSKKSEILEWGRVSKAFKKYISDNGEFWFHFLNQFCPGYYHQLAGNYNPNYDQRYIKAGKREAKEIDDFPWKMFTETNWNNLVANATIDDLVFYSRYSSVFIGLMWPINQRSNYRWFLFARAMGNEGIPDEYDGMLNYRQAVVPGLKYHVYMLFLLTFQTLKDDLIRDDLFFITFDFTRAHDKDIAERLLKHCIHVLAPYKTPSLKLSDLYINGSVISSSANLLINKRQPLSEPLRIRMGLDYKPWNLVQENIEFVEEPSYELREHRYALKIFWKPKDLFKYTVDKF